MVCIHLIFPISSGVFKVLFIHLAIFTFNTVSLRNIDVWYKTSSVLGCAIGWFTVQIVSTYWFVILINQSLCSHHHVAVCAESIWSFIKWGSILFIHLTEIKYFGLLLSNKHLLGGLISKSVYEFGPCQLALIVKLLFLHFLEILDIFLTHLSMTQSAVVHDILLFVKSLSWDNVT